MQPEEIRQVVVACGRAFDELGQHVERVARDEHVDRRGAEVADEVEDAHAEPALDEERQHPNETAVSLRDVHAQLLPSP